MWPVAWCCSAKCQVRKAKASAKAKASVKCQVSSAKAKAKSSAKCLGTCKCPSEVQVPSANAFASVIVLPKRSLVSPGIELRSCRRRHQTASLKLYLVPTCHM